MCVVSNVMDHYWDRIPQAIPQVWTGTTTFQMTKEGLEEMKKKIEEMQQLLNEFHNAVKLAEALDMLMQKKDCVDPEKEKLKERVAELEKQLEAIRVVIK